MAIGKYLGKKNYSMWLLLFSITAATWKVAQIIVIKTLDILANFLMAALRELMLDGKYYWLALKCSTWLSLDGIRPEVCWPAVSNLALSLFSCEPYPGSYTKYGTRGPSSRQQNSLLVQTSRRGGFISQTLLIKSWLVENIILGHWQQFRYLNQSKS